MSNADRSPQNDLRTDGINIVRQVEFEIILVERWMIISLTVFFCGVLANEIEINGF